MAGLALPPLSRRFGSTCVRLRALFIRASPLFSLAARAYLFPHRNSPFPQGGYSASQAPALKQLFATLQPNVVAFQAGGLTPNAVRWGGSESGFAVYPTGATVNDVNEGGGGEVDGTYFIPAETDFTLQNGDQWFYNEHAGVRSFAQLQAMYETSVGHNTALIIDFAPFPNGSLPVAQVSAGAALGAYVAACYGAPIVRTSGATATLQLMPSAPVLMDRVMVREDLLGHGQLVRAFTISATFGNGTSATLVAGSSVGNKFIAIFQPSVVASLTLNVTAFAGGGSSPFIRDFSAYACDAIGARIAAQHAAGQF